MAARKTQKLNMVAPHWKNGEKTDYLRTFVISRLLHIFSMGRRCRQADEGSLAPSLRHSTQFALRSVRILRRRLRPCYIRHHILPARVALVQIRNNPPAPEHHDPVDQIKHLPHIV